MSIAEQSTMQRNRLALILKTGRLRLWFFHPATRQYFYLSEDGTEEKKYTPAEFGQLFERDDLEVMRQYLFDICDGKLETAEVLMRSNVAAGEQQSHYQVSISVAQRDEEGRPSTLMGIQHDVTDVWMREQKASEMLLRYQTIFNTSQMDMLFYDKDGVLTDINERACTAFNVKSRKQVLRDKFLLENNPMYNQLPLDKIENTLTSSIIDFKDFQDAKYKTDEFQLKGKMYYESAINPIRNEQGELEGIYMAGRNISEMVESFHHQQEGSHRLLKANQAIEEYVSNINYALRVSGVMLVNYYPKAYTFEISNNATHSQLHLSQLRCIRLATPPYRRTVNCLLNRMDHLTRRPVVQAIETEFRDKQGRQMWFLFNMVPMLDADDNVVRYFGMCRNVTGMVETEQRLAVESQKAQETELLKQAFLTNMSYEIRTPLNSVVGFAELFNSEHDEADEPLFVEEIKRSTNTLLLLVNDVLFLSRLDARMEEYKKEETDFALAFESMCQVGMTTAKPGVKTVVAHPYNSLVVDIDVEHVGKIIQRLCALSCSQTEQGTITASYGYRRGELTISIEDTSGGIDSELLPHAFERFSRDRQGNMCGTGLDLPIVRLMAQQMGGNVDIQSDLGKGTTIWVSIPCSYTVMEKQRETVS